MILLFQTVAMHAADSAAALGQPATFRPVELIMKGGIVMIPLMILSLISIYYIIERYLYIRNRSKMDENLIRNVMYNLQQGNIDAASHLCKQTNSSLSNVIQAGIDSLGKPIEYVEKALTTQSNIELSAMESKIGYISIVSGLAPRLGFIGTILGVITIFHSISQTADISIGTISQGLYQKMISSVGGLIVGAIAYIGYNFLLAKVDTFSFYLQKEVLEFIKGINKPS